MPRMDGMELLQRLRQRSTMPIIFLTAKTGALDVVKGIQAGARHYITKPFSVRELLAKVDKITG